MDERKQLSSQAMQFATEFGKKGPGREYTYCGLLNTFLKKTQVSGRTHR